MLHVCAWHGQPFVRTARRPRDPRRRHARGRRERPAAHQSTPSARFTERTPTPQHPYRPESSSPAQPMGYIFTSKS